MSFSSHNLCKRRQGEVKEQVKEQGKGKRHLYNYQTIDCPITWTVSDALRNCLPKCDDQTPPVLLLSFITVESNHKMLILHF